MHRRPPVGVRPARSLGWLVAAAALLGACTSGSDGSGGSGAAPTTARTDARTGSTVVAGAPTAGTPIPASRPLTVRDDQPWPMHPIDSRYRGANALFRADVDGDGRDDYVTNYEFDQRYVVAFAPSDPAATRAAWPTMTFFCPTADPATKGCDTESAMAADLDGDGNLDIVGAQGGHPDRLFDGDEPGVRVVWGPDRSRARDATAWVDAGRFPATVDQGHYLWVLPYDVNGDGHVDVMAGGREYFGNGRTGGIVWLEAPADAARRRDLSAWTLHAIDPDTPGGHGFVLADLDGDGDPDVVDANADFDTPEDQEAVVWYRNPGPGSPDQRTPWPKTQLLRDPGFYGKPQVVVADLDGDGRDDLVTQTIDDLVVFRRTPSSAPDDVAFDPVRIRKPDELRWASRGLKVGDVDGDGRPDLVLLMTHDDATLPVGKASVSWLSFDGGALTADALRVHPIKWSPGTVSSLPIFGEKWDQVDLRDVDGDGDLDVVANDEEWMQEPDGELGLYSGRTTGESVALVWFENRLGDEPVACTPTAGGGCRIEAEQPVAAADGTWIERNSLAGASGGAYLQAFNGVDPATCATPPAPDRTEADCPPRPDGALTASDARGVRHRLDGGPAGGELWLRVLAPARFGNGLGGVRSDSAWVGLDGGAPVVVGDAVGTVADSWTWVPAGVVVPAGPHEVDLRVRERGFAVDVLAVVPAGGPPPS